MPPYVLLLGLFSSCHPLASTNTSRMTSQPAAYVFHQTDDLNMFQMQILQQQEVFPKVARFRVLDLGSFLVCFR